MTLLSYQRKLLNSFTMKMIEIIKLLYIKFLILKSNKYTLPNIYRKYFGIKIGKGCVFTGKKINFGSEPYLIEIGDNVRITADVKFETHDGGVGIFRDEYKGINIFGKIKIGDNSFIGHNSIIMPGVRIGKNVIIGAGSIVTKDILSDSVAVGVPAKVIQSTQEYKHKALKKAVFIENKNPKLRKKEILESLK